MKPVDHVTPTVPSNWVRRVDDRRRKKDPEQGKDRSPRQSPKEQPPGDSSRPDTDGRTHHIDDLA
ncbi:MAG: hypothetical protein R3F24_06140 [Gammaproteobacteria bacterium]